MRYSTSYPDIPLPFSDVAELNADLFEHKTPLALEQYLAGRESREGQTCGQDAQGGTAVLSAKKQVPARDFEQDSLERILARNTAEHVDEIQPSVIGNVLLTGATGFLGAHILKTMIETTDNTI